MVLLDQLSGNAHGASIPAELCCVQDPVTQTVLLYNKEILKTMKTSIDYDLFLVKQKLPQCGLIPNMTVWLLLHLAYSYSLTLGLLNITYSDRLASQLNFDLNKLRG